MTDIQTEVVFSDSEQFNQIIHGAKKLFDAVKTTMGPSGNTVIIEHGYNKFPTITKDGVTVAKAIQLKPKLESVGASLIKEVASKTNEIAGDGTTTATVFAYTLLEESSKKIANGMSPLSIKKGIDAALNDSIKILDNLTNKISTYEESVSVATISANGDAELGKLIAQAVSEVGPNGVVTVEPSKNFNTTLHLTNGMLLDSGYINPYFITNSEKSNAILENPYVLITDQKIVAVSDIIPLLEAINTSKNSLLIICDDVEGDALNALITNKMRGTIKVCAVRAPSYGDHRHDLLSDMADVLGTEIYGGVGGIPLNKVNLKMLGRISKATINKNSSVLVTRGTEEETKRLSDRVAMLENALNSGSETDARNIDRIRMRLAKLTGSVAVIRVGGSTEAEMGERKDRIEDALNATVAANREGVVVGGGFALLRCAYELSKYLKNNNPYLKVDQIIQDFGFYAGYQAFITACEAPFKTIVSNAGESSELLYSDAKRAFQAEENGNKEEYKKYGYNARTHAWGNLLEQGVLDPVLVTKSAVSYSASIIGLAISCKAVILDGFVDDKKGMEQ